jgi:hypothetical protein
MRNWTVQVLDVKGNVKFQGSLVGTEVEARSLLSTFEKKQWGKQTKVNLDKSR